MTSLIGHTINNRYRLESLLGDGGMGTVYRAYDLNLDRQIALKLMHAHFARNEEFRQRLIQEARTAAQLDHPSVVRVYDFGESESGLFIAMEYVNGGSLRDHLRRLQRKRKYLPLAQSLQIGSQIADALDYAHRRGIVHRDIKPGNIMLKRLSRPDEPGEQPFRALLTDFGLVKLHEGTGLTQSGTTLGTPTYMSPEQCAGEELDGRSDLYGLGVVLYELFTNRLPFNFQNLTEALAAHRRGDLPPLASEYRPDIPQIIDNILAKSLAKSPDERYESGEEMHDALHSAMVALEGAPTKVILREEMDILERVSEPPPGHELIIDTPGHPRSIVPLTQAVITLGRQADNEIVLPAEGVSRHHARLQATALGWEVIDQGGINGTYLNDRRLRADDPTPVTPGSRLRIGPYELILQGPEVAVHEPDPVAEAATVMAGTAEQITQPPTQVAAEQPLAIFLPNDRISVDPGQQVEMVVEVVNRSEIDDRVSLKIEGIPASWASSPGQFVNVPAGATVPIRLTLRPPRHRGTPTGRQRFRLELVSQQHPSAKVGISASLVIGTFVTFEASMDKEQVEMPDIVTVTVRNTGNAPADFSVTARDRQGGLRFKGERGRIRLESGQTAYVEIEIESEQSTIMGSSELFPFEIDVASSAGGRQTLSGEAYAGSAVPPVLLYGLLLVVVFACTLGALAIVFNRDVLFGGAQPTLTPTIDPTNAIFATQTAVAQATNNAFGTAAAATATVMGDSDGDGLSDFEEVNVTRTDPFNPDTDNDGLNDGQEFLIYGTDPLNRDMDQDLLGDGDEVNFFRTDPTRADTDGGSIRDGAEVDRGTNPLDPTDDIPATATATATLAATGAPTLAPTVTNTPPPSTTPTWTPTPSQTPTPSITPTSEPTLTSTPTHTSTPTNTPLPNPDLACLSTPPVIDGSFNPSEWPGQPIAQYSPAGNGTALSQVYMGRNGQNLYLVFLVNDAANEANDQVQVYFDTLGNGGDPDAADRFFLVTRAGGSDEQAGIGSNLDGLTWNPDYSSTNWNFAVGESTGQWVAEMEIFQGTEMPSLANPFGLMLQTIYTSDTAAWPDGANPFDVNTWQLVNNASCP